MAWSALESLQAWQTCAKPLVMRWLNDLDAQIQVADTNLLVRAFWMRYCNIPQ